MQSRKNQKTKIALTIAFWSLTIFASGIASAAGTQFTMDVTVDEAIIFSTCNSVNFPLDFSTNQGQVTPACTIEAASNAVDGFDIQLHGTNLEHTSYPGIIWDKLETTTGGMNTTCATNCTEAWGFRIANGTASQYETIKTDLDNDGKTFDSNAITCGPANNEPCWHTVNDAGGAETIISHDNKNGLIDKTASFDIEFGAVTSSSAVNGNYSSTITITLVTN